MRIIRNSACRNAYPVWEGGLICIIDTDYPQRCSQPKQFSLGMIAAHPNPWGLDRSGQARVGATHRRTFSSAYPIARLPFVGISRSMRRWRPDLNSATYCYKTVCRQLSHRRVELGLLVGPKRPRWESIATPWCQTRNSSLPKVGKELLSFRVGARGFEPPTSGPERMGTHHNLLTNNELRIHL